MNKDKRDFDDFTNKKSFQGIIDKTTGEYHFPQLIHYDSNNNKRIWKIKIRLIKGSEKKYGMDWDVLVDDTVPIKKKYLTGNIQEGIICQMWVESGVFGGKISRYSPTYPKIMNEGKSNERNVLQQALVEARSLYMKKIENGMEPETKNKITKTDNMYFPMLVRKYDDEMQHMKYPLYIQPKLDGARCITMLNKPPDKNISIDNIVMYSRQKKEFTDFNNIKKDLLQSLIDLWDYKNNESIYIDGELYKHGMSLQTISGAVRNPNRETIKKYEGIQLWIFDIFYPKQPNLEFNDRLKIINEIFKNINTKTVVCVPTELVETELKQDIIYNKYIKEKYEGVILRNANSLYLTHPTKNSMAIRSRFVLKRKMRYSDEFEVISFTQGKKGKDKGAIIWILKTHTTNKSFNATPKNISYNERYKLFKIASANNNKGFLEKFKGRMMTVEYEDLSKDEVPLRAKSLWFREHI